MTPDERTYVMGEIQAAWPFPPIADATVLVWAEHLMGLDYPTARRAVKRLVASSARQPAIAEFLAAYKAETPHETFRQLDGPIDKSAAMRVKELIASVTARPARPITETMLDAAGVYRWRERIRDALADDFDMRTDRKHYDETWDQIRAEYVEKAGAA